MSNLESTLFNRSLTIERLFRATLSPSQHNTVSQFLKDAETEMRSHQIQIDKLRSQIALLENKKTNLSENIARYRSLLSPIHKLPPEVLGNVFSFACEENSFHIHPVLTPPPLSLSSVCGRWREIALTMPSLWSSMNIRFQRGWTKGGLYRQLYHLVLLFLDRSKSSPLDIVLNFKCRLIHADAIPTLAALVSHSPRWQRLVLEDIPEECLRHEVFRTLGRHRMAMLTHLESSHNGYDDTVWDDYQCHLFHDCPSLTSLKVANSGPLDHGANLPWRQIKKLEIVNAYEIDGLDLLSRCSNVEQITLERVSGMSEDGVEDEGDGEFSHIYHPISKITILAVEEDDVTCILKHSTLHELSSLEIQGADDDWDEWDASQEVIADFLHRSSCHLTTLALSKLPISDSQTISLLYLLPTLTTLSIEERTGDICTNQVFTSSFLNRLSSVTRMTTHPFLPELAHVKFTLHADELDIGVLSRALTARWVPDTQYALELGIACIQTIDIVFIEDEDEEYVENLWSSLGWMASAGARLTVSALDDCDE
ncbi:hypothetical protein VNI00_005995 [Paramarasmius palmivorus]|uniref:F-box domain-containing protein n=1 Tax=Paramarasmius palmivorus TaxID=297713 RepID=A0AAW0DDY5_9AGAR